MSVKKISLLILCLSTFGFYLSIEPSLIKIITAISLLNLYLISKLTPPRILYYDKTGVRLFTILIILILFSFIPAKIYWDQSIGASLISTCAFSIYGLYLILVNSGLSHQYIEKMVVSIGMVTLILFFISFLFPSISIANVTDDTSRGQRLSISGGVYIVYLYFYEYIKIAYGKSNNIRLSILVMTMCIVYFLLGMGRSLLATVLVLSLVLYIIKRGKEKLVSSLLLVGIIGVLVIMLPITRDLISVTHTQYASSTPDQHVREIGIYYYLFEFPVKGINWLIGNGIPSYGKSEYGISSELFAEETKIHLVDIGLIGLYNYWGIIGLTIYVYILSYFGLKKVRLNPSKLSAKYVLFSLLGLSILSSAPLKLDTICMMSLCCYLLTESKHEKNSIVFKEKN